jgi:hypothetical protein
VHWKSGHKIAKRKGRVDFALFNIRASLNLMPVDNERKHGGVAEPIRRFIARMLPRKGKKRINQLKALISEWKNADRLLHLPREY